jgi:hypothetical protein
VNGLQHRWNYLSGQLKTDATNLLNLNGLPHVLRLDLLFCPEEMLSALDLMLQHGHKKIVWSLSPQNEQDEQCNLVLQGLTLRNAYWDPHHRELRETVREGGGIDVVVQSSFSKQQSLDSATHDKEERRALERRESNKGRPLVYGRVVAAEHGTREEGGGVVNEKWLETPIHDKWLETPIHVGHVKIGAVRLSQGGVHKVEHWLKRGVCLSL